MGISDLDPDAHVRHPWNAGNIVGAKRPLKPPMFGQSASSSINTDDCVIGRCLIW